MIDDRDARGITAGERWLLAWAGLIAVLLLLPPGLFPAIGSANESGLDKAGHVFLFFVLGWLALGPARVRSRRPLLVVVVAAIVYGALLEVVQGALGWRSAEIADAIADGIGALAGVVAATRWRSA